MTDPMKPNAFDVSLSEYRLTKKEIFFPIGVLLLLALQFQTLPLRIQIQTLPLTTVLALVFFPFVVRSVPRTPVLTLLMLFFGYVFFHSTVALFFEMVSGQPDTRFVAWLRQFFALFAGIVTFLVLRTSLLYLSSDQIVRFIVWGSVPALLLSATNILWGALGQQWAGKIVLAVHDIVNPDGFVSPLRATGFATEPAALATSLVIVMLPALFILFANQQHRLLAFLVLLFCVLAFAWTFSTIGILLLFGVLFAAMVLGPRRKLMLTLAVFFLAIMISAVVLFPRNQILRHAGAIAAGRANVSFTDRFYGAFGPFIEASSSYSVVGYGLGGVSTHFRELVPTYVQVEILETKWKEFPNLSILFGRLFAETGAIGLVLFFLAIWMTFRELAFLQRTDRTGEESLMYSSVRLGLIAVCISLLIAIGPYHTPYLWLWIAFVDSRYILLTNKEYAIAR